MVGTVFGKNTQALCQIIKIRFFVFFEGWQRDDFAVGVLARVFVEPTFARQEEGAWQHAGLRRVREDDSDVDDVTNVGRWLAGKYYRVVVGCMTTCEK
jgi:hypothetical protein